jgi:hypothetical protein
MLLTPPILVRLYAGMVKGGIDRVKATFCARSSIHVPKILS